MSQLEVIKGYMDELNGNKDNNAPAFLKLHELFMEGKTPENIEGHHYGVPIGLKTGDLKGPLSDCGNFVGFLWSSLLADVSPWVGKSFSPIVSSELSKYTEGREEKKFLTCLGINHFNKVPESAFNLASILILTFWMNLEDAPEDERRIFGYEKNGGLFIAKKAPSVYSETDREVFSLNYRWKNLNNLPPLNLLIDELVEIENGLYLGQLLFATKNILFPYDPNLPSKEYDYQHFGYFLLMDETWRDEAKRLFPQIGIPESVEPSISSKFTTFTFAEPLDGNVDDRILEMINKDMEGKNILELLKFYSDGLRGVRVKKDSPYLKKLNELFNRGISPSFMDGYLHGCLVAFYSEGIFGAWGLDSLNIAWNLVRHFSPWIGKIFFSITPSRLMELTDGNERGEVPTFWGENTYSAKTIKERITLGIMKALRIWTERPTPSEKEKGIALKSFFFIGHSATSVNPDNLGKKVFQFNYRWPKLRTMPPDNWCIDEIVQIAEGLYLGQLLYATRNLFQRYFPDKEPSFYDYKLFGYFLLIDDEWHKIRLNIGFDLDNA
ncbi:TPA: hypothetical protein DCX16_05085 [bacterium]|nr:hypothetical protein [bacterium]